jgi:hypothetical protein
MVFISSHISIQIEWMSNLLHIKVKKYNLEPQDLWPEWEDIKKDRYENEEVEILYVSSK